LENRELMTIEATGLYDPFTHSVWDDPYVIYRQLRAEYPVYRNESRDCWVLSRHADIQAASRDVGTFSNAEGVDLDLPPGYLGPGSFLDSDPPDHTRLRRILHEHFTPKGIERLDRLVRDRVRELIGNMLERGEADIADEVAFPLPMFTILTLMGFPEDDGPQLRAWLDATALRTPGSGDRPPECDEAHDALAAYVDRLLAERTRDPRQDLVTVMSQAVGDGRMSRTETHGMALLLLTAGWETTASLISTAFYLLATHPDQRLALVKDRSTIAVGVEEILRFEAPVQYLHRTTTADVTLHETTIPRGERVVLLYASGNRDERVWDSPDRLDVRRAPRRHVAFGEGIHHCIGAPLARLEARIAIEELLSVAPFYELAGPIERLQAHVLRGIRRLPVSLGAPAARPRSG
jgi:cytochrome P450